MSLNRPLKVCQPTRILAAQQQVRRRLLARGLLDGEPEDYGSESLDTLTAILASPNPSSKLNSRQRRLLPAYALYRGAPEYQRGVALSLVLGRMRRVGRQLFFLLLQEYFEEPSIQEYLVNAYGPATEFGGFTRQELAEAGSTQAMAVWLFQDSEWRLSDLVDSGGLKADGRLGEGLVRYQLSHADKAWLEELEMADLEVAFLHVSQITSRIELLAAWLLRLTTALPASPSTLRSSPAAVMLLTYALRDDVLGSPMKFPARWQSAPGSLLMTVRGWLSEQAITSFFESDDDNRRTKFWNQYAGDCLDFKKFPESNAFALRIGKLWFVEFSPLGACYIYRPKDFDRVLTLGGRDLKHPSWCAKPSISVENSNGMVVRLQPPLSHVDRGRHRIHTWQKQFARYIQEHS